MRVFLDSNGHLYAAEVAKTLQCAEKPLPTAELLAVLTAAPIPIPEHVAFEAITYLRNNPDERVPAKEEESAKNA